MRFLRKDKINKTIIVISDIHLGAGTIVNQRRNYLEDFQHDKELVDLLKYYSSGEYHNRDVELIINGDFFDLLSVPFVRYFDDEYWSEKASLDRLKMIVEAHQEVIDALKEFLALKNKTIVYILGNHDAELIFDSLRAYIIDLFPAESQRNFMFYLEEKGEYSPTPGIVVKHGHQYEMAHYYHVRKSVITADNGEKYFLPPWGSYYVTRVLNKFKEEKSYINLVRPIKKFLINGLIYDTLFTLRFIFASCYYFIMVRFIYFFMQSKNVKKIINYALKELELFKDYESLTEDFFRTNPDVKALVIGHTHIPSIRSYDTGITMVNTGTWTKVFNLDFVKRTDNLLLAYAQIDINKNENPKEEEAQEPNWYLSLNVWKGVSDLPYFEF